MPDDQQQCEESGGTFNEATGECTQGEAGEANDWQFEGLDLENIEHDPWDDSGEELGGDSSWNVTSDWIAEGGIHTLGSEEIIDWLATQGFGDNQDAIDWFTTEYGAAGTDLGEMLAFDQSQIDELGIGFAMQEDAMSSEFQEWWGGAYDMLYGEGYDEGTGELGGTIGNMETLAQQQLDAFDLANTERISQSKKDTADLRRSALQGLATTRRASARSGISSGMGSTNALDSFMSQSREQAVGSRAAQKDYLTSVTSTEEQRDFNIEQAELAFTNEYSAKQLANENTITQMNYDFAAQASSAYDTWYDSLVGMTGAYFQDTSFGGEDFDLFGTGG